MGAFWRRRLDRLRRWRTDRLAIRQVSCALLLALALGTAFNAIHLLHDYLQERRRIVAIGQEVLGLISAPAARAAFTLDHELSATVVRTLLDLPFVVRADLTDNVGHPFAGNRRASAVLPLRWLTDRIFGERLTHRASFDRHGRVLDGAAIAAQAVGSLDVEFDTRVLAQDFLARSWVSIATGTARTILLGAVLAVVTHLMITRPLARLVATVEAADPKRPTRLPPSASRGHERDELGRLARTIDALLVRVARALAQRQAAHGRLAASEARFVTAAETLPDGLAIFDAADRLVYHNKRYPEHQPASLRSTLALGKRFEDWLREAAARGPIHHPHMGEGSLEQRLALHRLDHGDHEHRLPDGRWVRVREARMPGGGLVLLSSDVTAQRSLEAELRQAEKLKAVGTLASGVAHDFNNILATIFTATEVALAQLPADAAARHSLERVLNAGRRARHLVGQILTFSRGERAHRLAIDLAAAVAEAAELCRPALAEGVELRLERLSEPVFVAADETHIVQLVSNLCLNAAQAMPASGRVTVSVEGAGRIGAGCATLRVRDTGCGMDAETAARAFEPFFTTKPIGQGTGLGLAVVHGIVQALGGGIRLRTALGHGTAVVVTLPQVRRTPAVPLPPPTASPSGEGRPVLLVEPDCEVAEAVARLLRGAGFRVTRHADPADALETFAREGHGEGLLVAELTMPGLSGPELAEIPRERAQDLPVILLADDPPRADQLADAAAVGAAVLRKPVLRGELDAALARA